MHDTAGDKVSWARSPSKLPRHTPTLMPVHHALSQRRAELKNNGEGHVSLSLSLVSCTYTHADYSSGHIDIRNLGTLAAPGG